MSTGYYQKNKERLQNLSEEKKTKSEKRLMKGIKIFEEKK